MTWLRRTLCFLTLCLAVVCSSVPRQYLREAVPNLTLSALAAAPQTYQGQLAVMGVVIVRA